MAWSCFQAENFLLSLLTRNKLTALLLGVFVTAIIQLSSATTVMVVSFVNSGIIMKATLNAFQDGDEKHARSIPPIKEVWNTS